MWFRLAAQFGKPVGELIEQMSSHEFTYWIAYYSMEPFGYEIESWRAGMQAAATANTAGTKKGGQKFTPADFIPKKQAAGREQSVDEQRRILLAMVNQHG